MKTLKFWASAAIAVTAIAGGAWFAIVTWRSGNIRGAYWGGICALLVGLMAAHLVRRYSGTLRGLPDEDERSNKVRMHAAGYSYYISLYLWFALWYAVDSARLAAQSAFEIGILGMAALWVVSWFLLNRKGDI